MPSSIRLILETALRLFTPWLLVVIAATWGGYPGVACITPMSWLLALPVGVRIEAHSTSPDAGNRLREAALAGALLGLLQGILFLLIMPRLGPLQAGEQASASMIALAMLIIGIPIAAGLSALTAWLAQRRTSQSAR